jgi:hypothetical protein
VQTSKPIEAIRIPQRACGRGYGYGTTSKQQIEFGEPVKTAQQAGRKVFFEKIVKAITLIDKDDSRLLASFSRTPYVSSNLGAASLDRVKKSDVNIECCRH